MAVARPPEKIEVDRVQHLRLLVKTNKFDPADWPPGYERGAELLREIRQIEQDCLQEHGRWHPDLLPDGGEDHYEELIFELDDLIEPIGVEPTCKLEDLIADLELDRAGSNGKH
jgi:hypothetical protein